MLSTSDHTESTCCWSDDSVVKETRIAAASAISKGSFELKADSLELAADLTMCWTILGSSNGCNALTAWWSSSDADADHRNRWLSCEVDRRWK
jgi:hypothetical protein